jgi:mevalonate kinase
VTIFLSLFSSAARERFRCPEVVFQLMGKKKKSSSNVDWDTCTRQKPCFYCKRYKMYDANPQRTQCGHPQRVACSHWSRAVLQAENELNMEGLLTQMHERISELQAENALLKVENEKLRENARLNVEKLEALALSVAEQVLE